jgi:hypothetical protein
MHAHGVSLVQCSQLFDTCILMYVHAINATNFAINATNFRTRLGARRRGRSDRGLGSDRGLEVSYLRSCLRSYLRVCVCCLCVRLLCMRVCVRLCACACANEASSRTLAAHALAPREHSAGTFWRHRRRAVLGGSTRVVKGLLMMLYKNDVSVRLSACAAIAGLSQNHVHNASLLGQTRGLLRGLQDALACKRSRFDSSPFHSLPALDTPNEPGGHVGGGGLHGDAVAGAGASQGLGDPGACLGQGHGHVTGASSGPNPRGPAV